MIEKSSPSISSKVRKQTHIILGNLSVDMPNLNILSDSKIIDMIFYNNNHLYKSTLRCNLVDRDTWKQFHANSANLADSYSSMLHQFDTTKSINGLDLTNYSCWISRSTPSPVWRRRNHLVLVTF